MGCPPGDCRAGRDRHPSVFWVIPPANCWHRFEPWQRPSTASRPAPTGISISGTPTLRWSISTWRAQPAERSCCASRTSTRRAAGRNSRRRSTRTSPGSASPGRNRCADNASISRTIGRRSSGSRRMVSSIQVSRAGRRSPRWSPSTNGRALGRAIPMAPRSIRAPAARGRRLSASSGSRRASHTPCGST